MSTSHFSSNKLVDSVCCLARNQTLALTFNPVCDFLLKVSETEYRVLTNDELDILQNSCDSCGSDVQGMKQNALRTLYKKGLVYLRIRVKEENRFAIPPLEVTLQHNMGFFRLSLVVLSMHRNTQA